MSQPDGWALLWIAPSGAMTLSMVNDSGVVVWRTRLPMFHAQGSDSAGVFLSSLAHSVVVGSTYNPFQWIAINSTGRLLLESSAYGGMDALTWPGAAKPMAWRALSMVQAGDVMIQTLVSLNSDERRFITYTLNGARLREQVVIAPLGFIPGCATPKCVLALRRTDVLELVRYEQ